MNVLIDALPQSVTIGGKAWPINTDFRVGIAFELLMQDPDIPEEEKLGRALSLFFSDVPKDVAGAVDRILWFYRCGKCEGDVIGTAEGTKKMPRAYDFDQDAGLILSAFWCAYHIDLTTEDIHWWKFRSLFSALPQESEFCKVMGYRLADTKGMSKGQKKHYDRMKKVFALREKRAKAHLTLEERNQAWRDYVERRFSETEGNYRGHSKG